MQNKTLTRGVRVQNQTEKNNKQKDLKTKLINVKNVYQAVKTFRSLVHRSLYSL